MALSDCIEGVAFAVAHRRTLENTPETLLEGEFCAVLTRHLITELCNAGKIEIINDKDRSSLKIRSALGNIRHHQGDVWPVLMLNRGALKMALEHELASRTTQSEYPDEVKNLSQKLSLTPPPQSTPPQSLRYGVPTQRFHRVIPPANDPQKPE